MNNVVIFAGGVGKRMRTKGLPKQFLVVYGKPIIAHTISNFEQCNSVDKIVIVCKDNFIDKMKGIISDYHFKKVFAVTEGGETGQESIWNGLKVLKRAFPETENVLIHDGVRPFITSSLIEDCIQECNKFGNAIAAAKATETVSLSSETNIDILEREKCYILKAPQCFKFKTLYECHCIANGMGKKDYTDSASMIRHIKGEQLHLVECPRSNIKVTTPEDYYIIRALFESSEVLDIIGY